MEQKKCSTCKEIRTMDEFENNKNYKDGKAYTCKHCAKEYRHSVKIREKICNVNTKFCISCSIYKSTDNFCNSSYKLDGKKSQCKQCEKAYRERTKEQFHKRKTIQRWQTKNKIRSNNYDSLYDIYFKTTHCYLCDVKLDNKITKFTKCLEHDHLSGYPRFVCCQSCNSKLMKIDNNRKDVLLELHRYFINNFEKIYLIKCIA